MTAPTIAAAAAPLTTPGVGLDHITCCVDDNLGVCGTDLTHVQWAQFEQPSCLVCAELEGEDGVDCDVACPKLTRGAR